MLFKNDSASLKLEIVSYEFPAYGGEPGSDDRNWLVLRATWINEDGEIVKDSNSCLLTYELNEMTAGLKVMNAGIKDFYESDFSEPYFYLAAVQTPQDSFKVQVSFYLPNTMGDEENAEVICEMTHEEMNTLIDELDRYRAKFPERK